MLRPTLVVALVRMTPGKGEGGLRCARSVRVERARTQVSRIGLVQLTPWRAGRNCVVFAGREQRSRLSGRRGRAMPGSEPLLTDRRPIIAAEKSYGILFACCTRVSRAAKRQAD